MRTTKGELERIISKQGYGVAGTLGKGTIGSTLGDTRAKYDVERNSKVELEGPESLQIKCPGKVRVRFKFYRYRLADYSRAISEKALIDALQYAGAIRGDSEKEIWLQDDGQEKVATKEEERTEITLEYPEVDFDDLWETRKRKDGR